MAINTRYIMFIIFCLVSVFPAIYYLFIPSSIEEYLELSSFIVAFILVNSSPSPSGMFIEEVEEFTSLKDLFKESYNSLILVSLEAADDKLSL
jgi:hypothetical protein